MLQDLILIASWVTVGLCVYMAGHNFRLWRKFKVPRRWGYALAYACFGGLFWEVTVFVISAADHIDPDWKSVLYALFSVGAVVGVVTIIFDHRQRKKDGKLPPHG